MPPVSQTFVRTVRSLFLFILHLLDPIIGIFSKGMRSVFLFSRKRRVLISLTSRSTKNERLVMHEKIGEMSSRITKLKNAIEQLQSLISTEQHPLLAEDSDQVMHPVVNTQPKKPVTTPEEDIIKAFGAFSIGDKGEVSFHEASATSEVCVSTKVVFNLSDPINGSTF